MIQVSESFSPEEESIFFTRYLINRYPNDTAKNLYVNYFEKQEHQESSVSEKKIMSFLYKNRWAIGFIDAGLTIRTPSSGIRKKIYIMFSILESQPVYADLFLAKERSSTYWLLIIITCIKALVKAIIGVIILKILSNGNT